jgi:hypothetical protein
LRPDTQPSDAISVSGVTTRRHRIGAFPILLPGMQNVSVSAVRRSSF